MVFNENRSELSMAAAATKVVVGMADHDELVRFNDTRPSKDANESNFL